MNYSFNMEKGKVVFAGSKDINASYKDLGAICDYVRYKNAVKATEILEKVVKESAAVPYRTNNKGMGSRHELGGRKGRYPKKAAGIVLKVINMAIANAKNKGMEAENLYIVHAAANKTQIFRRTPSKGMLYHSDSYGFAAMRHSDVEFAKVEIGIALPEDVKLGEKAAKLLNLNAKLQKKVAAKPSQKAPAPKPKEAKKKETQPVTQKA
ncbi:MAG: 50S ribosomal protein L22 [Candidatus Marsarchaeota archaeon]|nr:50S ribosomal protein L22 [Candidatus Marsarchaeota archaeon]